jgi:hypothetical protein
MVRYPFLIEKPAVEDKPLGYSGGILGHGRIPVEFNRALPSLSYSTPFRKYVLRICNERPPFAEQRFGYLRPSWRSLGKSGRNYLID